MRNHMENVYCFCRYVCHAKKKLLDLANKKANKIEFGFLSLASANTCSVRIVYIFIYVQQNLPMSHALRLVTYFHLRAHSADSRRVHNVYHGYKKLASVVCLFVCVCCVNILLTIFSRSVFRTTAIFEWTDKEKFSIPSSTRQNHIVFACHQMSKQANE